MFTQNKADMCLTEPTAASHLKAEAEGQTLAESLDWVLSVSTTRPKLSDPASPDRSNQLEHSLSDRFEVAHLSHRERERCQRTHWAPIESEKGCQKTHWAPTAPAPFSFGGSLEG